MRTRIAKATLLVLAQCAAVAWGADTNVRVIVSSEVRPGIYGRVDIGNAPPPVLVYERPVVIERPVAPVAVAPIYLHVPPGHAKNWKKHCYKYNACGQPVYFVRSAEYEPGYKVKKAKKEKD